MTRTLVIANQKGGIGKSTSAMNIGRALNEFGYRVLLIDLDPQGGLTAACGIDSYTVRRSTYSLLMYDNAPFGRLLWRVRDGLVLIPASLDLANAEIQLASRPDAALRLYTGLTRNPIDFDYILIDTPPSLGVLTANGMAAADELLIPVQCQYLAMRGVRAIEDTRQRIQQKMKRNLFLGGVFATMYQPDYAHSQEVVDELHDVFGPKMFQTVIPMADVVAEAPAAEQSVLDYAPNHPATHAYRSLTLEIINRKVMS
ncbi:MAG: ParA family protein [Anaerolineales bacterium]|nr:ParA family protein [Anaerolineales bacterium]